MTARNATRSTPARRGDAREMMLQSSITSARELLTKAADLLRRYTEELECYAVRFDDCGNDPSVKHETVLSWAVNHVASLQGNMRLDLFVAKAAEIAERRTQLAAGADDEA
jgi:hypothetical protein